MGWNRFVFFLLMLTQLGCTYKIPPPSPLDPKQPITVTIKDRARRVVERLEYAKLFASDSNLGRTLRPNSIAHHELKEDGETIFSVDYEIDANGHRKTPTPPKNVADKHLLLLGCSFAFGHGVSVEKTMGYQAAEILKDRTPYNFSNPGTGPNWTLAYLQSRKDLNEVKESYGDTVFVTIDDHLARIFGNSAWSRYTPEQPYFYQKGDQLIRDGSFATGRPFMTYVYGWILHPIFFNWMGGRYYPAPEKIDPKPFCLHMREIKKEMARLLPHSRFSVHFVQPKSSVFYMETQSCLAEYGIHQSSSEGISKESVLSPAYDGHFNYLGNRKVAVDISDAILQQEGAP